jgi:hypothetical protein
MSLFAALAGDLDRLVRLYVARGRLLWVRESGPRCVEGQRLSRGRLRHQPSLAAVACFLGGVEVLVQDEIEVVVVAAIGTVATTGRALDQDPGIIVGVNGPRHSPTPSLIGSHWRKSFTPCCSIASP